jgi:hypothetical protein
MYHLSSSEVLSVDSWQAWHDSRALIASCIRSSRLSSEAIRVSEAMVRASVSPDSAQESRAYLDSGGL